MDLDSTCQKLLLKVVLKEPHPKALTIIHNYYLKRTDGTTAAERLFGRKFADPFEWLVEHMGDLPLARTSKY